MATCPRLHPQRSFCRRAIHQCGYERCRRAIQYCDNGLPQAGRSSLPQRLLQAELQYFATKKIGIGRGTVAATPAQASYSTCRHDGTAVILDFRPRLANRCSHKVKTGAIRASILYFKLKLANRCSQKVKTGAICASILDFKPRLANRCSAEVKTGVIPAAQGRSIMPRPGNAGWAGTSDGVAARGFVNGEGPAAKRWEGKHRRCAPVRSPCPQADSDAKRRPCPQTDAAAGNPPQAESAAETLSTRHKKKSPDSSLNRDSRSAAATYSPTWCSSTIGASELNFSVRDGKRWILTAITAAI